MEVKIPKLNEESFLCTTGTLQEYSTPVLHNHACHQLLAISSGISLLEGQEISFPLYGDLFAFIPANHLHRSTVVGSPITYHSVYLPTTKTVTDTTLKIFKASKLAISLLEKLTLCKEFSYKNDCFRLLMKVVQDDMKTLEKPFSLPVATSERIKPVTAYLEQNYHKKISMSFLGKHFGYSARHLSRMFTAHMKISPMQYLKLYRLLLSSILLAKKKKDILDIIMECGYESTSCFYADFQKFFGVAPGKFRNQL